jgi:hypothetical protein
MRFHAPRRRLTFTLLIRRKSSMRKSLLASAVLLVWLSFLAVAGAQQSQDKSKRPSPPGTAEVTLKGKSITIDYSRPSMRGRKIMGALVPYGKVWRTGANEATTLTTPIDLNIGGTKVPAGKYTIWTLPSADTWKLIINKQTGQWGTVYDEKQDLARIEMKKPRPTTFFKDCT